MTADSPSLPVDDLYQQLAAELTAADPAIEPTQMFGSTGLKIHGKTFVILVNGRLVAKLPRARVDQLVHGGAGERFDPGHGRRMKEWIALAPTDRRTYRTLITEALTYVRTIQR